MSAGSGCGQFVFDKDLFGGNLEALPTDTTEEGCLQLCLDTAGCNGFSWLGMNCYIKNVGADVEFTDRPGITAYRVCPDNVKPAAPGAATPAATPPTAQPSSAATPPPATPASSSGARLWFVHTVKAPSIEQRLSRDKLQPGVYCSKHLSPDSSGRVPTA